MTTIKMYDVRWFWASLDDRELLKPIAEFLEWNAVEERTQKKKNAAAVDDIGQAAHAFAV